ncbi:hypothetical protein [Mycetocola zhadangensis]|nr:hypothetical protein [Mycetocola zhadangensis]
MLTSWSPALAPVAALPEFVGGNATYTVRGDGLGEENDAISDNVDIAR